jgi:hypothetical protein
MVVGSRAPRSTEAAALPGSLSAGCSLGVDVGGAEATALLASSAVAAMPGRATTQGVRFTVICTSCEEPTVIASSEGSDRDGIEVRSHNSRCRSSELLQDRRAAGRPRTSGHETYCEFSNLSRVVTPVPTLSRNGDQGAAQQACRADVEP